MTTKKIYTIPQVDVTPFYIEKAICAVSMNTGLSGDAWGEAF